MNVQGSINHSTTINISSTLDKSIQQFNKSISSSFPFDFGDGLNQCNSIYAMHETITVGSNKDYDLSGFINIHGDTQVMSNLKYVFLLFNQNELGDEFPMTVAPLAPATILPWDTSAGTCTLTVTTLMELVNADQGWELTSSNNKFRITFPSSNNTEAYTIVLLGTE